MGQKLRKKAIESLSLSRYFIYRSYLKANFLHFYFREKQGFKFSSRVTGDVVVQELGTEKHCIYGETERALSHDWKTSFQAPWASWGSVQVTRRTSPSTVFGSTSSESVHPGWQNVSEGHSCCPAPSAAWKTELWASCSGQETGD